MEFKNEINLDRLVGEVYRFYGVADNCMNLDNQWLEVQEDEDDGYRSSMDSVMLVPGDGRPSFKQYLARVKIVQVESRSDDLYRLVDIEDGHIWLEFGTEGADGWYPCFMFTYTPKPA